MSEAADTPDSATQLEGGTYDVLRTRLQTHGRELKERLEILNEDRKDVFGAIETTLKSTGRISTDHNCIPRDMVVVGQRLIVGYNVHFGLKTEHELSDVFAVYRLEGEEFRPDTLELITDERFVRDFQEFYRYFRHATFAKFMSIGPLLHFVFQVGESPEDIKTVKWEIRGDQLHYVDNRSDHEVKFSPQHEVEWRRTTRDQHRTGEHPHISIEDRVFVETVGGDLTIKVEDNTSTGRGIFAEPVENDDQTLDDATIHYAILAHLVLLRIRPYRESQDRYIIFNGKTQQAIRVDNLKEAAILLPDEQGIIFPKGYYLQSGEHKLFDQSEESMVFERRIVSPNGEDVLYVFYSSRSGVYRLLRYNMINQSVETPMTCHGFSLFEDGVMSSLTAQASPSRHHTVQLWQTPYVGENYVPPVQDDSYLYKVGNREIVRAMAECHEVLNLLGKDDSYGGLYLDLVNLSTGLLDSYFWINSDEMHNLAEPLSGLKAAANAAIAEFEKVREQRETAARRLREVTTAVQEVFAKINRQRFESIGEYVDGLAALRSRRGEVVALEGVRSIDADAVAELDQQVAEESHRLAQRAAQFLFRPQSLEPYLKRIEELEHTVSTIETVASAKEIGEQIDAVGNDLELLVETVGNLEIEDATQRTELIDRISAIFSSLNQLRAKVRSRREQLALAEGAAEFRSQMNLLSQGIVSYLDLCETPERCDEYLTKLMIQLEELESRFAELDEYTDQLAEKREEIYTAFESRKLALVDARNRRASALQSAANRILAGIDSRIGRFREVSEIQGYYASDLMIEKVRDIVGQLEELDDSVKVDEIQTRLKTIREEAIRSLEDRQELFVGGDNVIRLGKHTFSVNTQEIDLAVLQRQDHLQLHITGTSFFEPIRDPVFDQSREVWDQSVISENPNVYRAEYLARLIHQAAGQEEGSAPSTDQLLKCSPDEMLQVVGDFMKGRYQEEYTRGVHDEDASRILRKLLEIETNLGLLRYAPQIRVGGRLFWDHFCDKRTKKELSAKLNGFTEVRRNYPHSELPQELLDELAESVRGQMSDTELIQEDDSAVISRFLFDHFLSNTPWSVSGTANTIVSSFQKHIDESGLGGRYEQSLSELRADLPAYYRLIEDWLIAAIGSSLEAHEWRYLPEAAFLLFDPNTKGDHVETTSPVAEVDELVGSHSQIRQGSYILDYHDFQRRLDHFQAVTVPQYLAFHTRKRDYLDEQRKVLKLEEYQPQVLSSFVRNQLLDEVYLPLIGDNFSKQLGAAGEQKRTDRMGLLLLVSPPGYGKTTLIGYVANRLGLVFMKVNGPAIGHAITSLDPSTAPNAGARDELVKLNLAFEMGDNVIIYLDDIQHLHPEFLQKFISLCDAQRKIEGVWNGESRTYDLRGRKVAVVMAGNPYTESGESFQIPDMLSNRADIYNLGEIIGDNRSVFELSYIENAISSNPVLNRLSSGSKQDVLSIVQLAEGAQLESVSLKGDYSAGDVNEMVSVMHKLLRVRDVVLRVNREYIDSAAMTDEFRTEPPFKLQGSYRNMNRIAERVLPVMNDAEVEGLILASYENDAQTLAGSTEANLLKFRELTGHLTGEARERLKAIRDTFQKNNRLRGVGDNDPAGRVVLQLSEVNAALENIATSLTPHATGPLPEVVTELAGIRAALAEASVDEDNLINGAKAEPQTIRLVNRLPKSVLNVLRHQFELMEHWLKPTLAASRQQGEELQALREQIERCLSDYRRLISLIGGGDGDDR